MTHQDALRLIGAPDIEVIAVDAAHRMRAHAHRRGALAARHHAIFRNRRIETQRRFARIGREHADRDGPVFALQRILGIVERGRDRLDAHRLQAGLRPNGFGQLRDAVQLGRPGPQPRERRPEVAHFAREAERNPGVVAGQPAAAQHAGSER